MGETINIVEDMIVVRREMERLSALMQVYARGRDNSGIIGFHAHEMSGAARLLGTWIDGIMEDECEKH
jgi:hypothetical protein